ncbi:myotubularin-related protein 13-like [Limulus polyphemus]|uniref:Myotubularin-related protein 13-like n=1 Tax=Limulus polyphemus TaxID=6850 RepID=A0ABM1SA53_LIMPO|nr:myotubularin-related protein 13-like [Limulus polyphemus]
MSRLADYFVIVGFDHDKARNGISIGKILQRFPEKDWEDTPFIDGIELFCQPQGWSLSTAHKQPTFFVSVLTDIDANRHYCACLSFNEPVAITPSKPPDEEGEEESLDTSSVQHHSIMYAPKCLVLVSSLDYFATFRNCLGIIYSVYIENMPVQIETLIGNILGCIQVPPPGGPQVRFSIGAGDRQALQPPLSTTLPVSHSTVYQLFEDLGIHNVVTLFAATMTEHKILFESRSYTRLTEACHALTSLMYPFKYSHVYIPLLPAALVEVLSTPTPFTMGVHSSLKAEVVDLLDVIVVDLDGGSITLPECISVPTLPEPLNSQLYTQLCMVMRPELLTADDAFPPQQQKVSPPNVLDKEIRAIFLRMFTQLLQGYRSCLTITRIHPKPIIAFHKAAFLGQRNFLDNDFVTKVLDCMFFNTFVSERGPPYRVCDIFDELYAGMQDVLKSEAKNSDLVITHIQDVAQQLLQNENPNPQPYVQKIPKPTEGAFRRIHQPTFPLLDHKIVEDIMQDGLSKHTLRARLQAIRPQQPRIVPMGSLLSSLHDGNPVVTNSARRLEVLRNCVNCIFENKISDARKTFPAVLRALKNKTARLALTQELAQHVTGNKAMLEHQQFDLVVRLLNCALQDDSSMDEHGVAASILPLCMAFCRKLCTGVIQFAFTCIQDHPVWANQQFWEAAFYQDVQRDIKALYLPQKNNTYSQKEKSFSQFGPYENKDFNSVWNRDVGRLVYDMISRKSTSFRPPEPSALEIAAEQMRLRTNITKEQQEEMVSNEESTVYSQAIHYANRMVSLRIPLDINKNTKSSVDAEQESNSNSNLTNSLPETDSLDAESGFEEDTSELGTNIIRFVSRFVDKVCTESGVTEEHIKSLHQMIPGVVAMQIETLEAVHRESKRLPPIMKPKILAPSLLQGEELVMEGLRVYLIPDGREDGTGGILGGPSLLPAEGAIFLTNYRIVFKGTPCDPFASEQVVVRCFPVATLTKEKRLHVQCLAHVDQFLQEGLQIRSSTFQLIKVAFDEEVTSDNIEMLRKLIHRVHAPPTIYRLFAFSSNLTMPQIPLHKHKEKNATLKVLAKKTLLRTAMKAGFKSKPSSRKHKYVIQGQPSVHTLLSPGRGTSTNFDGETGDKPISTFDEELSILDEAESSLQTSYVDSKTLEKITERTYCRDYQRLGLGTVSSSTIRNKSELFRVTSVNSNYSVCRRFPVITWCHPQKKALLLRGSSFLGKGVIGILKGPPASSGTSSETSAHIEQEKFISTIVDCTPIAQGSRLGFNDSTLSITSLLLGSSGLDNFPTLTPELAKRGNPLQKAVNTLRSSGGKSGRQSRWGSLKGIRQGSFTSLGSEMGYRTTHISDFTDGLEGSIHTFHRVALYVLGEKAQIKGIKPESYPNCDFVPVDFTDVRQIKTSFKKLMRACIPSDPITDPDLNFFRSIENSEWLNQLQIILQLSGVVVDLMDVQGSSVMICLEDGWDFTSQVSSIAQLCLDPYYRTFEGFRTLIEKEWLAFGHRFSHRGNHTAATLASGFTPVFLQFLDVVHQIHLQFPLSFEFNQYFLKFMAYHYASCRFRTFLLDSECEREEAGWLTDDRGSKYRGLDSGSDDETGFSGKTGTLNSTSSVLGLSLWEYIDKLWTKSAMFYNFFYIPFQEDGVLRPYSNISNLEIWDYYLKEELSHGPPYDLEAVAMEKQREEESEAADGISRETSRRIVNTCYDNIQTVQPDVFGQLLEVIPHLETELGHLPQKWLVLWDKLELPSLDSHTRQVSFTTQLIKSHGRSIHKRSTIEILVRGKMIGETTQPQVYSHPHRFEKYNYTTPTYCDSCSHVLWGLVRTGMRCMDCGYNCHEKCMESVPKNCTKYKSVSDSGAASVSLSKGGSAENSSVGSSVTTVQTSSQYYNQFSSNVAENRTHEGYLFKRGALLKGWKQRWFVLDSIKHQLRYYDVMEEPHCKGFIDMEDVVSVTSAAPPQGVTKKCDEKAFFDLRTVRRIYNFMAADGPAAQEWIEKIQACLQ